MKSSPKSPVALKGPNKVAQGKSPAGDAALGQEPASASSPGGAKESRNLPSAWTMVRLVDIAEINPRQFKRPPSDGDIVSFVPMKAVQEETGKLDASQTKLWSEVKKGYTPFQDGDLIFAKITPCMENGKYALASGLHNGRAAGSTEFHVLRPSPSVDPKFLLFFLFNPDFRRSARANMKGTAGQLRVPSSFLEEAPLPLPPLPDQHLIAAEIEKQFTRLDEGVAALKRVQANLKRYCASVLKAACEGRLVPTEAELARAEGRSYEPADVLLQRIVKERRGKWTGNGKYREPAAPDTTKLPKLPEGWCWATMAQLGELNRGKSKHRPRDEAKLYSGPYPFIQTGDIKRSAGVVREHSQTYSEEGLKQSRLWPAGTLAITIAANIAETGILTYSACFPDSVVGFVFDGDPVLVRYVQFYLRTIREKIERYAPATAQKNINLEVLSKVAIALPPFAEQHRIVAEAERQLSVVNELETVVSVNLHRADRLRQSILKVAFEGRWEKN